MIRITEPAHQRRFSVGAQEIVLDYCAVKLMQLSVIGPDIYAYGARVTVVWGCKNATGEFVAAEPLVHQEFSLANVREEKRVEYFQRALAPLSSPATRLPIGGQAGGEDPAKGGTATVEQRQVTVRPADHTLRDLLTPKPGQGDRRFGDARMRDFENWLVATGRIEGVLE